MTSRNLLIYVIPLLTALSLIIFFPGLSGPFVFDDYPNLEKLNQFNNNPSLTYFQYFKQFFESGNYQRPISIFSFVLQHQSWPDNPLNFKIVNLIIHYINAILVALLSFQLGKHFFFSEFSKKQLLIFATLSAFIWLIHPIQQSSTFYVVQRMAQLSAFFILAGLNFYLYWLPKLNLNRFKDAFFLTITMGLFLVLATFSKENGLLLVLYIALINHLFKQKNTINEQQKYFQWFKVIIILIPICLFAFFMYKLWDRHVEVGEFRGFPHFERALTETRIIFSYLKYILLPDVFSSGLFHDDIVISKSLFSPISTLFATLGVILLLSIALFLRKPKTIIIFAGIYWFFISHSMESTFIPLELYFEHRNYLAVLGVIWIVIYFLMISVQKYKRLTLFFSAIYLSLILAFAWQGSIIWSSTQHIVVNWAQPRTHSSRSQIYIAYFWLLHGYPEKGKKVFDTAALNLPNDLALAYSEMLYNCLTENDNQKLIKRILNKQQKMKLHIDILRKINAIISEIDKNACINLSGSQFKLILQDLHQHPKATSAFREFIEAKIGQLQAIEILESMKAQRLQNNSLR